MAVSAVDSLLYRNIFGNTAIRAVFTDKAYVQNCIDVEAALARAESQVGIIPSHIGQQITDSLSKVELDYERLGRDTGLVGYPILPLVKQLAAACDDEAGGYVHWGATTQDIQDTATMLQMKDGLAIIERQLVSFISTLESLAIKYKATPMSARTHLQHALPTTFGHRVATYLSAFTRHLTNLRTLRPQTLLLQFGGAAGTLASLVGSSPSPPETTVSQALNLRTTLASILGLNNHPIPWHTARDPIAQLLSLLSLLTQSLAKIALDITIQSSSEVAEISEPYVHGRGASSTMPQKRNPISSEYILAAGKLVGRNAALVAESGMVVDFERSSNGGWQVEWLVVPESFVLCSGALGKMNEVMEGLVVHEEKMKENLGLSRGQIVGEAVMMELGRHLGRQRAHEVVYGACVAVNNGEKGSLFEVLGGMEEVVGMLGQERLRELCGEDNYLGAAERMVDDVVAWSREKRAE